MRRKCVEYLSLITRINDPNASALMKSLYEKHKEIWDQQPKH